MKVHRKPTFYELESNSTVKNTPRKRKRFKSSYIFLILAILYFLVISYKAFKYTFVPVNIDNLPLIESDNSAIRVEPADRGGIVFANQDREIYNHIKQAEVEKEPTVPVPQVHTVKSNTIKAVKEKMKPVVKPQKTVKPIKNVFDVLS